MKKAYGVQKNLYGKTKELIYSIDNIIMPYKEKGMKISVRQVYYQCVARKIIDNNKEQYNKISDVIKIGRMAGLLDWDVIEDRTRYTRENVHFDSPQEILQIAANQYRIDTRATQPFYLECWIEKDSLVSILETTCKRLDVPCFSCRGFSSITALHEAALRFNNSGKKNIILYAGDHDPSGLKIPATIQEKLKIFNANVELKRIGLTLSQIEELNLPPFYAKEKDSNYSAYVKNTGTKYAWELDALPPEKLSTLFEQEINALTDFTALRDLQDLQNRDKSYLLNFIND